ncbi:MAG: NADH-quinone oxidoreductase subunit NuoE [Methylococcales bacterium]|nr:NADH-quinone oxidoreductase subunit NuoE [Methylococcales bacterium]
MSIDAQTASMLNADDIRDIKAEMAHYPDKAAAAVEALKIVQRRQGWVSDAALTAVASLLDVSTAQLEAVATFYNLIYRQPVGETVIHYCSSVTCWMLGADDLRERLCRHLNARPGQISPDGRYTLLPIACLGACDQAPALMVGERLVTGVGAETAVTEILGEQS